MKLISIFHLVDLKLRYPTYDIFSTEGPLSNVWEFISEDMKAKASFLSSNLSEMEK